MPSYLRPHTEYMKLESIDIDASATYPDFFQGMVDAARGDGDIVKAIDSTVRGLGFNTFMYGCAASWRPNCECKTWTFTTLPAEWVPGVSGKCIHGIRYPHSGSVCELNSGNLGSVRTRQKRTRGCVPFGRIALWDKERHIYAGP